MNKEFIPYELAVELKKLGFDELCLAVYRGGDLYGTGTSVSRFYGDGHWELVKNSDYDKDSNQWIVAPTYSQAFRWFREKYELSHSIELTDNSRHYFYDFTIYDSKNRDWNDEDCFDSCKRIYDDGKFGKYEEAELECFKKLIEIVKAK